MRSHADRFIGSLSFATRWRLYFRERFPLPLHAPVIAVFSGSSFAYSWAVQGQRGPPVALAVAFAVVLLFFLQLRILDEFKDFSEDLRFRPYRPVPRGIVTLRSLGRLGVVAAVVQAIASALLGTHVLIALVVVWAYSALMGVEFFASRWLKAHPLAYLASHMVVVPLIVGYVATCAGVQAMTAPLLWLGAMSYMSFCVFEIGRKIRSPADEQQGVETYSALWGRRRAAMAWLAAMALAGAFAALAARHVDALVLTLSLTASVIGLAMGVGAWFVADPRPGRGKSFLAMSGIWLVVVYLALGVSAWLRIRN
ncbi:MAG TPA: UbiA family prenyltransferase [Burkholderiaceae bacterium]|nr:UbiA family prenyltransferase [Burkholderiaceae bacterium]